MLPYKKIVDQAQRSIKLPFAAKTARGRFTNDTTNACFIRVGSYETDVAAFSSAAFTYSSEGPAGSESFLYIVPVGVPVGIYRLEVEEI